MATAHSGRHSAAVKSISRQAELRGRKASHERQAELSRQREELAQFLDAFGDELRCARVRLFHVFTLELRHLVAYGSTNMYRPVNRSKASGSSGE